MPLRGDFRGDSRDEDDDDDDDDSPRGRLDRDAAAPLPLVEEWVDLEGQGEPPSMI